MSGLDDRKKAWETKLAKDGELRFKATARRNKKLGLWAADKMGRSGDDAEQYAREVIKADFEEVGDEDVVRKVKGDFDAAGVDVGADAIREKMAELMGEAIEEVERG